MPLPDFLSSGSARLAHTESLVDTLIRGLAHVEPRPSRRGRIYASDGGLCERQGMLKATLDLTETASASLTAYAKLGDSIEEIIIDALRDQDIVLLGGRGSQLHLPDIGMNLGGYCDGVILYHGEVHILEIKSCGQLPKVPKPNHAAQASIYSAVTGLPAIIFYFSRSVAKWGGELLTTQFDLNARGEAQSEAMYRVAYAHFAHLMGVTPDKPRHMDTEAKCGFCPFIPLCHAEGGPVAGSGWPALVTARQHLDIVREVTEYLNVFLSTREVNLRRNVVMEDVINRDPVTARRLLGSTKWANMLPEMPVV